MGRIGRQGRLLTASHSRHMPEMPDNIQQGIANMDIGSRGSFSAPQQNHNYSQFANTADVPHLSPFPKLVNPPPSVPQSDEDVEATLENARLQVLNSNDPEMQLAWAQDALVYVGVAADNEDRIAAVRPHAARSSTPQIEHQLKTDAMNIVTFLADQHHPKAEFMRGMWLEWGRFGMREDKKEAFRCYSRAADRGYTRAEYRIGMLYESYNDPIKALRHYHKGVDAGDSASCYRLGMMTLRGQHGQQQDFARAIELIRKSAQAADENAAQGAYVYGMLLARQLPQIEIPEQFLQLDERGARVNIEKAAYLKFAKAQLKMGSAYELGTLGCEFSPALSVHYNALASKQGEAEADMALSKWFLVGSEGLFPKNEELAYTYAEKASQSGLATAEFALGYFNEIGMYVPVDLEKALEWYQKAAKHGNADAKGRIEGLSRNSVLSKKDHEKVAITRIKSQYGSQRGQRPDRLRQQQQPSRLGQVSSVDEVAAGYANGGTAGGIQAPSRASTTTPYPMQDGPPILPPADNRPASVAPYPLEDGPIRRLGPTGGFFNPQVAPRPATTVQPEYRPSSAFNINPDVRSSSSASVPTQASYQGRASISGGSLPPPRPATAVYPSSDPRARPSAGPRIASGPAGMPGYGQPAGPGFGRPEPPIHQSSAPVAPPQLQQQPSRLDIGFSAPPDDRRNRMQRPSRQDKPLPTQGQPFSAMQHSNSYSDFDQQAGRPPKPPSRPGSRPQVGGPVPRRDSPNPSGRLPMPPAKDSAALRPNAATSSAPAKPPAKGPKTFDEMGVPAQKDGQDCVSQDIPEPVVNLSLISSRL